jgi:hypothetical protein
MGGLLQVESILGRSTFWFALPVEKAHSQSEEAKHSARRFPELHEA